MKSKKYSVKSNYTYLEFDMRYRCCFIIVFFLIFLASCERSSYHETQGDTSAMAQKDSTPIRHTDSLIQNYKRTIRDTAGMVAVLVEHSAILFKEADTTSAILKELSFNEQCLVPIEDILDMKSIVRCIHDSITGYVRSKELFKTVSSASLGKKYMVWLTPDDSVKVVRINTDKRLFEEQLKLKNTGVYISAHLLNADSWPEAFAVIQIEMNPAACEATSFVHVMDYDNKLKFLIETSAYGDEGGSYSSELLFKKGLLLHVITTESWQDDENGPVRYKTVTEKFKWDGDSLIAVGIKK